VRLNGNATCRPGVERERFDGSSDTSRVRICANKVVAGVRWSRLQFRIRPQDTRQCASAQQINQLEGLAVAIPWGFESSFRSLIRSDTPGRMVRFRVATERDFRQPSYSGSLRFHTAQLADPYRRGRLFLEPQCRAVVARPSRHLTIPLKHVQLWVREGICYKAHAIAVLMHLCLRIFVRR
jgi:hypothetical protein